MPKHSSSSKHIFYFRIHDVSVRTSTQIAVAKKAERTLYEHTDAQFQGIPFEGLSPNNRL